MKVSKQTTYYCKDLTDAWIDINDDESIALCGFDWDGYTIQDLETVSRFIQHVVDVVRPSIFDDPRQMKLL